MAQKYAAAALALASGLGGLYYVIHRYEQAQGVMRHWSTKLLQRLKLEPLAVWLISKRDSSFLDKRGQARLYEHQALRQQAASALVR